MKRYVGALLALLLLPAPALAQADLSRDVREERQKYGPTPSSEEKAKLLNAVAWKHRLDGWGLSSKRNGNNCPMPGGELVACDILHHRPSNRIFDVLAATDPGEPATPTWADKGWMEDTSRPWVAPVNPGSTTPPPPPPPPDIDLARLQAAIEVVSQRVTELAERHSDLQRQQDDLAARVTELLAQPTLIDAAVQRAVAAAVSTLVVTGNTAVAFRHQHRVELLVCRRDLTTGKVTCP